MPVFGVSNLGCLACFRPTRRRRRANSRRTTPSDAPIILRPSSEFSITSSDTDADLLSPNDLASFPAHSSQASKPCPICFEELRTQNISAGPCLHQMHTACLKGWFRQTTRWSCPVCRFPFLESSNVEASSTAGQARSEVEHSLHHWRRQQGDVLDRSESRVMYRSGQSESLGYSQLEAGYTPFAATNHFLQYYNIHGDDNAEAQPTESGTSGLEIPVVTAAQRDLMSELQERGENVSLGMVQEHFNTFPGMFLQYLQALEAWNANIGNNSAQWGSSNGSPSTSSSVSMSSHGDSLVTDVLSGGGTHSIEAAGAAAGGHEILADLTEFEAGDVVHRSGERQQCVICARRGSAKGGGAAQCSHGHS